VGGQAHQKKVGYLCPCGPSGSATYYNFNRKTCAYEMSEKNKKRKI